MIDFTIDGDIITFDYCNAGTEERWHLRTTLTGARELIDALLMVPNATPVNGTMGDEELLQALRDRGYSGTLKHTTEVEV